ncbi:MAG: hypothetical protein SFV15_03685 [Polyangiaceae bacterium]|nr:hypothetical protein [Polyangiaceae bacterium]
MSMLFRISLLPACSLMLASVAGCGQEEIPYKPVEAYKGPKASLPAVPSLSKKPVKDGDAYTVEGAGYYLRSRVHRSTIAGKKIDLVGYITKTTLPDAPECAVHKGGVADPEDCKPPIPAFWIGDTKDAKDEDTIKVMGWASNYAQIYDAIAEFDKGKDDATFSDTFWGVQIPNPLPVAGAKVRVTGTYSTTFGKSSAGVEANPFMGLLDLEKITYIETPEELATLPGVKRRPKK